MATGSYLSIITLNVNGLNAPTKDKDWLNGYKNKTPIYVVYKSLNIQIVRGFIEGLLFNRNIGDIVGNVVFFVQFAVFVAYRAIFEVLFLLRG